MPLTFSVATTTRRTQVYIALAGVVALEILFGAMHRLNDWKLHAIEFIALGLAAGAAYLVALYALEHAGEHRAAFWVILAGGLLFRLTLAPLEPSLSTDLYRYRWDGHIQAAGWNPYAVRPDDPRLTALRDAHWAEMPAPDMPTIYPPVAELVFHLAWRLTWNLPSAVAAFKAPMILADISILAMLAWWFRRTGEKNFRLAVYAWNPLVVVEFAGSGHNDALVLAFVLAALLIIRRYPAVSTALLTAGRECGEFRAEPKELSREPVHRGGLVHRRSRHSRGAGSRRGLRTCAVVGGAARRVHARGVFALRSDPASFAERLFLVLHMDGAAAVLFSKPGVAAADRAAVSFLQRLD